jgi:hypothetical protein
MRPNVLKAYRVSKLGKGVMAQTKISAPEPLPDLTGLKRAELVDLATARGVEVSDEMTKRQIAEALNG